MRVPINWLKELVNFKQSPKQLSELLTMGGLETVIEEGGALEVDIIPNRADCWSIRGIAREVSALAKAPLVPARSALVEADKKAASVVKVEVRDKKLCPRYMARVIENIKIAPSPDWLKQKLESVGIRSINNVVDVTNYMLMELGQPMHAFDAGLISQGTIVVRRAEAGEKVKALDENEYELGNEMLVIADPEKPVAIAGVMGLANSEVRSDTSTVILESAFFDRVSIHKTSTNLKLRSESSVRFERGVDWVAVEEALDRGAALIAELAGGQVLKGKIDKKAGNRKPKVVTLRPQRVNQLLGAKIKPAEMTGILKRLGFGIKGSKISIPLYRAADIEREIDLIEEIARVYGYHKIEATMPNTSFAGKKVDVLDLFHEQVKTILTGCGLTEVQTDSMVGPVDLQKAGLDPDDAVRIANPLVVDQSLMRTMLAPSLLKVIQHNRNRQIEDVFIFELGKAYHPDKKQPKEKWVLSAAVTGSPFLSALDKMQADYSYLKGVLENLLARFGLKNVQFEPAEDQLFQPGRTAQLKGLGLLGELHPEVARQYDLEKTVCLFELDLDALFAMTRGKSKYRTLPKFPSVSRDIAMFVPAEVSYQMIVDLIKKTGGSLVEEVFLFDRYKDSQAYRIVFRDPAKTLTDLVVNEKHQQIVKAIESKLQVRIRR
ncbi:MAG: phenylalanine--tRNA ligase subunit beta [Candidatus Saganbacteria bacterium]|nr:phenylalanine--tRNA ligase subunit beta [Candidatus Saganbacteria bacterium]